MPPRTTSIKQVQTFPQLVKYLRDELDWPIESDNYDEISWEYDPEELGLKPDEAAKIDYIRQMRPLTDKQPFGIFFVKFSKGKLPVVALRRILSNLVVKRRASANRSDRPAWEMNDLLFLSSWGEKDLRQMNFAHFADNPVKKDLPTLKVLDWGKQRTGLHVKEVERRLRDNLAWPEDPGNQDEWRENWRGAFTLKHRQVITTSKELAEKLAVLASDIRERIREVLKIESDKGPVTQLMQAFKKGLVHDLDEDGFADMYAQTIAYGLLSARIENPSGRTADDLPATMPVTNPFLKELMETFLEVGGRRKKEGGAGIDFDELGVSDVIELLDVSDMEAVVRDFGDKKRDEDPVIHFYENFLHQYNPEERKQRGVFYTPQPVVSFIVRSVDELLRNEFGLEDGLAATTTWGEMAKRHKDLQIPKGADKNQPFVQILDPATGTGTFPVEVIDVIYNTMTAKWKSEGNRATAIDKLWNEYVPRHLLPRLYGYELLMAPYTIAHLKVGLKLYETGYKFASDERVRIYLTNALEPAIDKQLTLDFLPALAHEAQAVNDVKRRRRFTIVVGNPPYSGISSNMTPWIDGLLKGTLPDGTSTASYYHVNGQPLGERKLWLQDDYVKFIRLSQHCLTSTGVGIHGYISNHGYLDNPTFRGMRWSLMDAFDDIRVLDLHGNLNKRESPPGGGKDVNVFDIQQGVGIGLFIRRPDHQAGIDAATVRHTDLWGDRDAKSRWLIDHSVAATEWQNMPATEPFYLFEPFDQSEAGDYCDWPAVNEVMPVNVTGIVTARDGFVIDIDESALTQRIATFLDKGLSDKQVTDALGLKENYAWRVKDSRQQLREAVGKSNLNDFFKPILYRPFDTRSIFWHPSVVWRPRTEAMPHMLAGENLAIGTTRRTQDEWSAFPMRSIMAHKAVSRYDIGYIFPLYLYPGVGKSDGSLFHTWPEGKGGRRPNLDPDFVEAIAHATCLKFVSDGRGDLKKQFGPEDVLAYIYAVFHCPEYRRRFEPMLKLDFPRVPPPGAAESFTALAQLGHDLLALHLLETPKLAMPVTEFIGNRNPEVEKVSWTHDTVWLDKAQTAGFRGVREPVWNFHIGGYQVCQKWLKDRKGRILSKEDIAHYHKIVVALSETIRLMAEINKVIEKAGGWPDAFAIKVEELPKVADARGDYSR